MILELFKLELMENYRKQQQLKMQLFSPEFLLPVCPVVVVVVVVALK